MTSSRSAPVVSIIVPCYNEEAVLQLTASSLCAVLDELTSTGLAAPGSSIHFVDDGSKDRTWAVISALVAKDTRCNGIRLSRNFGHQHAVLCGLLSVPGDATISIDADLQDDVNAMKEMLAAYASGADVVYAVRRERQKDTWFKRATAEAYYRLAAAMGVQLVFNHADYRLLSRRAIAALTEYGERNLFLRGMVPQLGFNSSVVYYDRRERAAGDSKYPIRKMISFAIDGITSFSAVPLKMITVLGLAVAAASFATAVWALWVRMFNPAAVPGWTSTVVPLYFLGGIQLLCTGIIGQYLAKVYIETKQRPRFTIDTVLRGSTPDVARRATND